VGFHEGIGRIAHGITCIYCLPVAELCGEGVGCREKIYFDIGKLNNHQ